MQSGRSVPHCCGMAGMASTVSRVVVFERGALVTRVGSVPGEGGEVCFDGLPLCLDDESVRVELAGQAADAGWAVADARVEVHVPAGADTPEPEDERALAQAEDAYQLARARLEATEASLARLRAVKLDARRHADKNTRADHDPTEGRLAWLELQASSAAQLLRTVREQREAVRQAHDALVRQQEARAVASQDRRAKALEPRKRVVVRLSAGESCERVSLELSYQVPGARWAPSYVLRLHDAQAATLQLRAVVAQNTREDWRGARVTVSTASLQTWHDLPRLDAIRVGRSQPPVARSGWREPPPDPEQLFVDYDRAQALRQPVAGGAAAGGSAVGAAPPPSLPFGAAPPPAPQAEVAVPPGGAASFAAAPAPAPERQRRAGPKKAKARSATRAGGRAMDFMDTMGSLSEDEEVAAGPPTSEPTHGLGRAWSDYGRLRLPMPWEARRGRLRRVDVLTAAGVADVELVGKVRDATRRARSLASDALPGGHAWVRARPGHAHAYVCDAAVDIPSDGQGHVVAVLEASVEASRSHVCVPSVGPEVFRTLAARSPLDQPLPPGPLDVYDGDAFLLGSRLDATAARGRFEVGLGVEQAIKVARNVTFNEDSEGLLKKHNTYAHVVTIDVRNLLGASAALEVRERVPVAAPDEDDIEVSEQRIEPPWDHFKPKDDPLEGGRRWRVDVPAGESCTLRAAWTVRVPGSSELVGGNRRDG